MQQAERQQHMLTWVYCSCPIQVLVTVTQNYASTEQRKGAYPNAVGVTNAATKQERNRTILPVELFLKRIKRWKEKKHTQKALHIRENRVIEHEMKRPNFPSSSTALAPCSAFWPWHV